MGKLFSTKYNAGGHNLALLVLRIGFGILMANHGYDKLVHFSEYQAQFMDFMGIGRPTCLALTIFAELFCSVLLVLGLFTRLACIPLIIVTLVIIFKANNADFFGKAEIAVLYFTAYLALLLTGAGRWSVDNMISK